MICFMIQKITSDLQQMKKAKENVPDNCILALQDISYKISNIHTEEETSRAILNSSFKQKTFSQPNVFFKYISFWIKM